MANRTHVDPNLVSASGLKTQLDIGVGSEPLDDLKTGHRASTFGDHRYSRSTPLIATKRSVDDPLLLFEVTLDEALAIYAQPKRGRGTATTPPLRELGVDPTSERPIVVKEGRFGAYVTDGATNRTLPRDVTPESITPEQAVELLAEKRAQAPAKKKPAARKPAVKKPAAAKK